LFVLDLTFFVGKKTLISSATMTRTPGIKVASEHIPTVKQALYRRFYRQIDLAEAIGLSRSTVYSYLNGKPVSYLNFIEISERLELDWQAIALLPPCPQPVLREPRTSLTEAVNNRNSQIDYALIRAVLNQMLTQVQSSLDELVAAAQKRSLDANKSIKLASTVLTRD
jgi:transcriptional regulator with XRE-family HTH domain